MRVDDGVREGDAISPFYDSMIAKLIVHGDTREQALARLDAALAATRIVGLATNVQFLRRVLASDSFATAKLDTALIAREHGALFGAPRVTRERALASATASSTGFSLLACIWNSFPMRSFLPLVELMTWSPWFALPE